MNNYLKLLLAVFIFLNLTAKTTEAQSLGKQVIWNKNQVIEPAALMAILKNPKSAKPPIYNIGFVSNIPGAKALNSANKSEGLSQLKKEVSKLPKTSTIVIYCGCCPFEHCPNVRPAYTLLKSLGYHNTRILNLPTSLKADWMDKGYPLAGK